MVLEPERNRLVQTVLMTFSEYYGRAKSCGIPKDAFVRLTTSRQQPARKKATSFSRLRLHHVRVASYQVRLYPPFCIPPLANGDVQRHQWMLACEGVVGVFDQVR